MTHKGLWGWGGGWFLLQSSLLGIHAVWQKYHRWKEHIVFTIKMNAGCCYEMFVATYHIVKCHNHAAQYRTDLLVTSVHCDLSSSTEQRPSRRSPQHAAGLYETWKFITIFTSTHYWKQSWTRWNAISCVILRDIHIYKHTHNMMVNRGKWLIHWQLLMQMQQDSTQGLKMCTTQWTQFLLI